jgi:hypothetical protein
MSGALAGLIGSLKSGVANSFESIATVSVSSTVSSVTFSSIPSTYKHLQIRAVLISSLSANNQFQINGDTATNYTWHQMQGDGASNSAYASNPSSNPPWGLNAGSATYPMVSIIDILDYADTNKFKTVRTISGNPGPNNRAYRVGMYSGAWRSTSAVTSISFYNDFGSTIQANSHFALYGIKGA